VNLLGLALKTSDSQRGALSLSLSLALDISDARRDALSLSRLWPWMVGVDIPAPCRVCVPPYFPQILSGYRLGYRRRESECRCLLNEVLDDFS